MARENLGKIMMTPKGEYNNTATYEFLDVVSYNGNSYVYISKETSTGIIPTYQTHWQVLALKGDMPRVGVDYFTEADKQEITNRVIENSNEDIEELFNALDSNIASGTDIHITDAKECRFIDASIKGISIQNGEPSIESEAPLESVGDNINLFDISTVTTNKFVYADSGELGASTVSITSDYIPVAANETYTALLDYETLAQDGPRGIALYDNDKKYISGVTYTSSKKGFTYTPTQSGYLRFSYDNNCTVVKFSKGTSTGAYSPYGQGSIEIKQVNRNFLDLTKKPYDENSSVLNGAKVTLNGGVLNVDATNSTGAVTIRSIWADYKSSSTILLPKGTYYTALILNITGVESLNSKQVGGGTFTLEENCYLTQWFFNVAQGNKSTKVLQLEKGSTATEYVEHQSQTKALYTQQPFRAIGDVKDRFVKKMGKWYEEHKIIEFSLGSKEWTKSSYSDDTWFCGFLKSSLKDMKYPTGANIMCNKFSKIGMYTNITDEECINNTNQFHIRILASRLSENSETGLVNYLKENPIYVYYELAEPLLIPCTAEQVEILKSLKTFKGVNNIYADTNVGKAEMEIKYAQDLKLYINGMVASQTV